MSAEASLMKCAFYSISVDDSTGSTVCKALTEGGKAAEEKDHNKHKNDMKETCTQETRRRQPIVHILDGSDKCLSFHTETYGVDFRKNFLKLMKEFKRLLEDTRELPDVDVSKNREDKLALTKNYFKLILVCTGNSTAAAPLCFNY